MGVVINLPMLFIVTVSTHSDWLAILNGSTAAVIACHLCLVHLAVLSRADFLLNTQQSCDSHMRHAADFLLNTRHVTVTSESCDSCDESCDSHVRVYPCRCIYMYFVYLEFTIWFHITFRTKTCVCVHMYMCVYKKIKVCT